MPNMVYCKISCIFCQYFVFREQNNVSKPNPDDLKALANIYEISIDELIGYISPPTSETKKTLSKSELLHIEKYRALDERGKISVDIMLDAQYEALKSKHDNVESHNG